MLIFGASACTVIMGIKHLQEKNLLATAQNFKRQDIWEKTFNTTKKKPKRAKSKSQEVNPTDTDSWFKRKRHLDKLPYHRLIFLDPNKQTYEVVDGNGKSKAYLPQKGNYLINIDKQNLHKIVHDIESCDQIYSANETTHFGKLYLRR